MESILAILCIVFFVIVTYGLIQGANLTKFHKDNCRTIYLPEHIDLETAFKHVDGKSLDELKKRGRSLGASKGFVDKSTEKDLKIFIIQNSISDEHILFNDLSEDITIRERIKKREYCRHTIREMDAWFPHDNEYGEPIVPPILDENCPTHPNPTLADYDKVVLPPPKTRLEREQVTLEDPAKFMISLKEDMDNYEEDMDRHNYVFVI